MYDFIMNFKCIVFSIEIPYLMSFFFKYPFTIHCFIQAHDEVIHQLGVQEKESLESLTSAADEDTTNQRSQLAIKMRVAAKDLDHICQVKLHHIAQEAYSKVGDHLDLKHLQIYIEKAFPTFELGNYEDYIKVLLSTILFESNLKSRLNSKSLKTEDQKQSIGSDQQQKLQLFDHEAYLLLSDYMHHDHHPVLLGLVKAELESARVPFHYEIFKIY